MRILVINGPNLNLLGMREPDIYGHTTYDELQTLIRTHAANHGIEVAFYQSNHEGALVDAIQEAAYPTAPCITHVLHEQNPSLDCPKEIVNHYVDGFHTNHVATYTVPHPFDALIINPAAYTHTSVALLDALKAANLPTVEIHISNPLERENFRHISYVGEYAEHTIRGKGLQGYIEAVDYLINTYKE